MRKVLYPHPVCESRECKTRKTKQRKNTFLPFVLILSLFATFVTKSALADDGVWVEKNDNSKTGFIFAEEPIITFQDEELVITTTSSAANIPLGDIRRLYFGDVTPTGIDETGAGGCETPVVSLYGEKVILWGIRAGTAIQTYDPAGRIIAREQADKNGQTIIDLSSHPKGIYIIHTSFSTIKIEKK